MIRSMTGFGAAVAHGKGASVRAEIRSVNHRHLQLKLRLPGELAFVESQVESILRKKLGRGAVSLYVSFDRHGTAADVVVDTDVARRYRKLVRGLARDLGIAGELELADLVQLPGVVGSADSGEPTDADAKLVLRAVREAAEELLGMRTTEGEALAVDLEKNAKAIDRLLKKIERRMPTVVKTHHANLKRRVQELVGDTVQVSEADIARELALLADRLDVDEEVSRLAAHLAQLRELVAKGGPVGRKLDFLAQEFFREANTIGSKCNDAKVSHDVVELKTHIERLREQVQNVE